MDEYQNYLELLDMIRNDGACRSALERCKHGFFADKLDLYLRQGILRVEEAADSRDDKFFLTSIGTKLWRHEIKIEDVIKGD